MLAASVNNKVFISDDTTDADATMSNMKDNPWTHEWY